MITKENIDNVIELISLRDKKRIQNTDKEYIVLELCCTNNTQRVYVTCTNNYSRYQHVSDYGDCILEANDSIFCDII